MLKGTLRSGDELLVHHVQRVSDLNDPGTGNRNKFLVVSVEHNTFVAENQRLHVSAPMFVTEKQHLDISAPKPSSGYKIFTTNKIMRLILLAFSITNMLCQTDVYFYIINKTGWVTLR